MKGARPVIYYSEVMRVDEAQKSVAAVTALAIAISEGRSKRELIYISEMLSLLSHAVRAITIAMIDLGDRKEKD